LSNSSCESSEDRHWSCALQDSGASDFVQKGLENSLYLETQGAERELFAIGAALAVFNRLCALKSMRERTMSALPL